MNTLTLEKHCWAEIDLTALRENYEYIRRTVGGPVCAVVKADAYGHGDNVIARVLQEAGAAGFAVSSLGEGRHLRRGGITTPILILGYADPTYAAVLAANDLITTCYSTEYAQALSAAAVKAGVRVKVHLKIDTGMGRYGFLPEEMEKITPVYHYMDTIHVTGIYTHLHSAFCDKKATKAQIESFNRVLAALREAGIEPGMAHILNSSGVLHFSGAAMDAVRVGSALLGRVHGGHGLKHVGYCETQVEELKWLPKGHTTGYGAGWKAKRPTRVAILPVGWYNGFGCEMGNDLFRFRDCLRRIGKAYYVTINGKRCKVLGHIGMLHTAADVSGIQCSLGDMARVEINPLMQKGMDVEWR